MRQLARLVAQTGRFTAQTRKCSHYVPQIKPATMNEMPVPAGSWAEHYNANQKKYNMHLFLGVTIFAASIYAGIATKSFFLNWTPEYGNKK